ncbi:hypothetical protein COX85_00560 [Candidatus Micrarchaeota archaeon CG_4_10_14_0_2_um_filter_55_9]|nr:MAG: hypothetical protein AUJ15_03340 [Candidatus Micrarchaeota archaeon CG1_02_55_41]PIO03009.1 MAG: hypothetical protein COT57_01245 [Candidatus Micrarchaeota archaeon CG09_land_8_20_14_0_10_55_25]PIZ92050.1 MAG: hypothetical protein COX85_00560 [Candidatus Micrarchaeota archaeon CG_4_10_14_0_2_um_filter_55_9]PJD01432.1 MAG: hypothetical protein COU38_01065 [Candidatus Micrarchaeota archaeon CG10_big_fil_rev_8_21_14_0_10_54_18]
MDSGSIIGIGAVVLTALVFGIIFSKLKLSASIGYIVAGLLMGPMVWGILVPGEGLTNIFGELGIMMLMFYLGMEMNLKKLRQYGAVATLLAFVQIVAAFSGGFLIAKLFGFNNLEALIIGALMPMASTVMTVRFIMERKLLDKLESQLALSVLIVEDFAAILVLVFLNSFSTQQSLNEMVATTLLFVIAAFYVVGRLSRFAMRHLELLGHADKISLYALGVGIIIAFMGDWLGLSSTLGAFFAGFALAETSYGERVKHELGMLREFFILFFFVALGASTTIFFSWAAALLVVGLVAAFYFANFVAFWLFGSALGVEPKTASHTGLLMLSMGEFSLIIASFAANLNEAGCTDNCLVPHADGILATAFLLMIVTAVAAPLIYSRRDWLVKKFLRIYPRGARKALGEMAREAKPLEDFILKKELQNEYAVILRKLVTNMVIAVSIVYVSYAVKINLDVPFLPFLPQPVPFALVAFPLVIWPLYRFVSELRRLTQKVSATLLGKNDARVDERLSDVFVGLILTAVGVGATALMYYSAVDPLFYLIPGTYSFLAVMFLGKSIYGLFEGFEILDDLGGLEDGSGSDRLSHLAKEFEKHAKKFRKLNAERVQARERIQEALQQGEQAKARRILYSFKKKEFGALKELGYSAQRIEKVEKEGFAKAKREEEHTRRALEEYFKNNPPFKTAKKR